MPTTAANPPAARSRVTAAALPPRPPQRELVLVLHAKDFGGSERHTIDLVNHLTATGWRLTLILGGLDLVPRGLRTDSEYLEVIRTELPVLGVSRAEARAWRRLFADRPAPGVLFIKPWYFAADLRFLRLLRRSYPRVIHLEHSLTPERLPYRVRWWGGIIPGLGLWWWKDWFYRRAAARTADLTLTVSQAGRDSLLHHAFLAPDRVVTCPNGVALDHWLRDPEAGLALRHRLGIAPEAYLFGTVSHLVPIKGIDLAIRAFARLPGSVALCIAGDGPSRAELESLARELGVSERVHFLGHVQDVRPVYSALDTLLCPSTTESFSLACLEAMACGCRVIASEVGGLREVVDDPICGELVPSRDPAVWAEAMRRQQQTPPDERAEIARRVRERVSAVHDQRRRLDALAAVLREELARRVS